MPNASNDFADIFNPNDVSNWIQYPPEELLRSMPLTLRRLLYSSIAWSEIILQHSTPDCIVTVGNSTMPLDEIAENIKRNSERAIRVLDTSDAYLRVRNPELFQNWDDQLQS